MDTLRALFDLLKNNAYEVLAILLPGAMVVEVLKRLFDKADAALRVLLTGKAELKYIGLIYVLGTVLQGLMRIITDSDWFRKLVLRQGPAAEALRAGAAEAIQLSFTGDPSASTRARVTVAVALSKMEDKRSVYDKFTALRDMARGVCAAMVVSTVSLSLAFGLTDLKFFDGGGALAAFVLGAVGSLWAYRRYAPLADEAICSQVIASKLPAQVNISAPVLAPKPDPDGEAAQGQPQG